jgi:hypothetical protein
VPKLPRARAGGSVPDERSWGELPGRESVPSAPCGRFRTYTRRAVSSPAIKKPTVFLSHAATDEPIVRVLHDEITRIFANGVDVFATSVPGKSRARKRLAREHQREAA